VFRGKGNSGEALADLQTNHFIFLYSDLEHNDVVVNTTPLPNISEPAV